MIYVGIDVGGTGIQVGLVDESGKILCKGGIVTRTDIPFDMQVKAMADCVLDTIDKGGYTLGDVKAIGAGVPGVTDPRTGNIAFCTNLGWVDVPFVQEFNKHIAKPVFVGNDATVAGLAESVAGVSAGSDSSVFITLGTGVGGGIIIDGRILTGTNGAGGEIGHIHIEDNETEVCGCKNKGCLEQYASATGITRLANRRLAKDDAPSILRGGEISAKTVFDAVKAGDKVAIEIAEQFGEYLGKGLAAVASVVDPQIFVIGGGVSKAGDILFKYIEPSYKRCAFGPCKQAKFALAELGNDAGIYGAAALVLK